MSKSIFLLLLVLTISYARVAVTDLANKFTPADEADYINYLNLFLGKYDESAPLSQALSRIVAENRPSLFNAAKKVVLLLVPHSQPQSEGQATEKSNVNGLLLKKLITKLPDSFSVHKLPAHDESAIQSYHQEGVLVNVITGDSKSLETLAASLKPTQSRKLFQKQAISASQSDSTYLIKFFFSLLFIIVVISILSFIASNDGKKDTLLYAKFIADFSNSR